MSRKILGVSLAAASALTLTMPALEAVTDGQLDGNGHPYVGLMVAQTRTGQPLWRCSGTLISPRVFLTAGHCTEAPAAHVEIWFDADVESGIPANGYPYAGDAGGKPYTHPDYNPSAFYLYDLGVVLLSHDVTMPAYGALPELNVLDTLATTRGLQNVTFTAVGYGLQESFPDAASFLENNQRIRMVAYPHLLQINTGFTGDFSILLSNNATELHRPLERGWRRDLVRDQRELRRDGRRLPRRSRGRPGLPGQLRRQYRARQATPRRHQLAIPPVADSETAVRTGGTVTPLTRFDSL